MGGDVGVSYRTTNSTNVIGAQASPSSPIAQCTLQTCNLQIIFTVYSFECGRHSLYVPETPPCVLPRVSHTHTHTHTHTRTHTHTFWN